MRRVLLGLGCVSIALLFIFGVEVYRHYWQYYRLFFANTAGDITHEERARVLALGGTDALHMMVLRILDEDPGAEQLAIDALEIMHSDAVSGPEILFELMADGNEDALSMVAYISLRARLDRERHPRIYQDYDPDRVIRAVQRFTEMHPQADPDSLGPRALAALKANYDELLQAAAIRRFRHSLPDNVRNKLWKLLLKERAADSTAPALLFDQDGRFKGQRSLLLVRYIKLFTSLHEQHAELNDEQLYEVASILGNDLGLNARYFFDYYRQGLPEGSRVIVNPTFDYAHTGDNLPSIK